MNNIEPEQKSNRFVDDRIFESIKSGKTKMRPKWFFVLRDVVAIIAIVIILLIVAYLASFIIFVLHESGAWFVPVFGLAGWYSLFSALPWVLISLSAIFVVVVAFLVKRYQFGYQWPLLYSFLGIIFLVAAVCFIFIQSSFSNEFFTSSISRGLPLLGMYYPGVGVLGPEDVHRGVVVSSTGNQFVLRDSTGKLSNILVNASTSEPIGYVLKIGDMVVIFGNRSASGTIIAAGIESLVN